ncbi:hypothetical protein, partial [Methylobacterium sp. Leaf87]|uniref:hypothetical protein n=1 Tax=Methylobacterium sp. Leaf87 TaxID=1736243 RepID=UPI001AEBA99D
ICCRGTGPSLSAGRSPPDTPPGPRTRPSPKAYRSSALDRLEWIFANLLSGIKITKDAGNPVEVLGIADFRAQLEGRIAIGTFAKVTGRVK